MRRRRADAIGTSSRRGPYQICSPHRREGPENDTACYPKSRKPKEACDDGGRGKQCGLRKRRLGALPLAENGYAVVMSGEH